MTMCPICHAAFVANTVFCAECGAYMPKLKELHTEPLDASRIPWPDDAKPLFATDTDLLDPDLLTIRLRIGTVGSASQNGNLRNYPDRELQIAMIKPIRLGRLDPREGVYPEIDLTPHRGEEGGVSRRHAQLIREGDAWFVVDLDSTNGTYLNGDEVSPKARQPLNDGDHLGFGDVEATFHIG